MQPTGTECVRSPQGFPTWLIVSPVVVQSAFRVFLMCDRSLVQAFPKPTGGEKLKLAELNVF